MAELVRFTAVIVIGLGVDLGLALALHQLAGLQLWLAAAAGFAAGAVSNYILHELWTFRSGARRLSGSRAAGFAAITAASFATRIGAVAFLSLFLPEMPLGVLIIALGLSFSVNYGLSRSFVFHPQPAGPPPMLETLNDADWQIPDFETATYADKHHAYALVIPVINEGDRIRAQLDRVQKAGLPADVIVADGGSTDGSLDPDFVNGAGVRAVLTKTGPGRLSAQLRMGYAWCLRQGYAGIVTIDGNGKDGVEAVANMVAKMQDGCDFVQGSRYAPGGQAENTPLERTIGNRMIHAPMLSLAGRHWFTDTTNGFRAYSRRYLLDARVAPFRDTFVNYELLFYLTVRAGQLGYRVAEVPVRRSYPVGEATPTKIIGTGAKTAVLRQAIRAATGAFAPNNRS